MPYSIVFLSSSEISNPLLNALIQNENFEVKALICQPDRPAGRGQKLTPPKSKVCAESHGIPVFQSENLRKDVAMHDVIAKMNPYFLLTFAYGQILSQKWLDLPKIEALNVHTSLLPKYRGASPIQTALLNGDSETGISLMRMVKAMDKGPVFAQTKVGIESKMNAGELHDTLAKLAGQVIPDQLLQIAEAELSANEQDHATASYCHKISKQDAYTNFSEPALVIFNKFRAYSPWPNLWTMFGGKRLKILGCSPVSGQHEQGLVSQTESSVIVGCSDGALKLETLQLEGKKACSAADLLNGNPDFLGSKLG